MHLKRGDIAYSCLYRRQCHDNAFTYYLLHVDFHMLSRDNSQPCQHESRATGKPGTLSWRARASSEPCIWLWAHQGPAANNCIQPPARCCERAIVPGIDRYVDDYDAESRKKYCARNTYLQAVITVVLPLSLTHCNCLEHRVASHLRSFFYRSLQGTRL